MNFDVMVDRGQNALVDGKRDRNSRHRITSQGPNVEQQRVRDVSHECRIGAQLQPASKRLHRARK